VPALWIGFHIIRATCLITARVGAEDRHRQDTFTSKVHPVTNLWKILNRALFHCWGNW